MESVKEKVIAIVPAAGIGKRFSEKTRKSFAELNNKPLIIWPLETLESLTEIHEIIPVLKEEDMAYGVEIFEQYNISKIRRIAPGGQERQDSVFNGLKLIDDDKSIVLVHDGVRPLIQREIVQNALQEFHDCDGIVVGVTPKDTIKEVEKGIIMQTFRRESLCSIQTPQIFYYRTLYNAYEKAMQDFFYSTDDSALVERYGGLVKIVPGSYTNIKVTTPEDLMIAGLFFEDRKSHK